MKLSQDKTPVKTFLKWPGNKTRLLPILIKYINEYQSKYNINTFVEPFIGSAALFLNTNFKTYYLNDCNHDLINLYLYLIKEQEKFIKKASQYYIPENNNKERYYELRDEFNNTNCTYKKSLIFLYLNRHGYNGLCRYNSKGGYNVPFGSYKNINFPVNSLSNFYQKANSVKLIINCLDYKDYFTQVLNKLHSKSKAIIYLDPPYVPWSASSYFTAYAKSNFDLTDQQKLVELIYNLQSNKNNKQNKNIISLVSNHDLDITRDLYSEAKIISFSVQRYISCQVNNRKPVQELLAIYD